MEIIHRDTNASLPNAAQQKSILWGTLIALVLAIAVAILLLAFNPLANNSASSAVVTPLPFGPGWAADYGTFDRRGNDQPATRPFGPGIAADYGTFDVQESEQASPLPFGPGIAADYGVPAGK